MLHFETVEPETLDLLKSLQSIPEFGNFRLVGGTGLALQFGHRISIDLDFFGQVDFSTINFDVLLSRFDDVRTINNSPHIKQYFINDIKVDFVQLPYKWIDEAREDQGVTMALPKEIGAMKLAAVTNRGTKKDFVDIFLLLKHFQLNQLLEFYKEKYPDGSEFLVLKSLTYFDDAEDEEMPEMLTLVTWGEVKEKIISEHIKYVSSN